MPPNLRNLLAAGLALASLVPAAASPILTVRPMFPQDNVWNVAIDTLPVDASSAAYVTTMQKDPSANPEVLASLAGPVLPPTATQVREVSTAFTSLSQSTIKYEKFTGQDELGHFLLDHYKIRTPKDLTSCEVCHR